MRILALAGVGVIVALAAFFLIQNFFGGGAIFPPNQGSTMADTLDITEEWRGGRITNASIPIEDIRGGGPRKDGIPSLDNPQFVSVAEAQREGFDDGSFGLSVEANGEIRFYSYQILVWHEIVNDVVGGKPLLITYCPLCFTGIVFDREVQLENGAQTLEFGVSGLLYDNNLLMYNRVLEAGQPPETLWSQARGEAVAGPLTGTTLSLWPTAETVEWSQWKINHPDGKVLSRNTGYARRYDGQPYGDYFEIDNDDLKFPLSHDDDRLRRKEIVEGVVINGEAKAYVRSSIEKKAPVEDSIGGVEVVWRVSNDGGVQLFNQQTDKRIGVAESFWFSWVATHPDTLLWP